MIKFVMVSGLTHEFEEDPPSALDRVLEWFRAASANDVLTMSARNGTWHLQKRHVVHIEVRP